MVAQQGMLQTQQGMQHAQQGMQQMQPQQFHREKPIYYPPYLPSNEPPYTGGGLPAPHPWHGDADLFAWSPSKEKHRCRICACWVEPSHLTGENHKKRLRWLNTYTPEKICSDWILCKSAEQYQQWPWLPGMKHAGMDQTFQPTTMNNAQAQFHQVQEGWGTPADTGNGAIHDHMEQLQYQHEQYSVQRQQQPGQPYVQQPMQQQPQVQQPVAQQPVQPAVPPPYVPPGFPPHENNGQQPHGGGQQQNHQNQNPQNQQNQNQQNQQNPQQRSGATGMTTPTVGGVPDKTIFQ